ncbi:tetratricopeptide repeat protein [uncultured Rhodospira sp.]|uniref:O-linked N-acetylglucosamine transferase, SPINDLY family protein n=1 Tax=uncultured Rhodospira sp. TaxID=1936189 RepID=UPI00260B666B|nr:tetratricopeptide repeat protein [uncultured Rhodospira sp.]
MSASADDHAAALAEARHALDRNDPGRAETLARAVLDAAPETAVAYHLLGQALLRQGRAAEAVPAFRAALRLEPDTVPHQRALAQALEASGDHHAAYEAYHALLIGDPGDVRARWTGGRLLPRVYRTTAELPMWRERFTAGLGMLAATPLDTPEQAARALQGIGLGTNFMLSYQGEDDRALQALWGRFVHRAVAVRRPDLVTPCPPPRPPDGRRLRVGYVSEHFWSHTIALLFGHWVIQQDRERFEVYTYAVGGKRDASTETFARRSDVFRDLRADSIVAAAGRIREDAPDVVVFPDLGMTPRSFVLAACRLAPLQCVSWGHPVTTGLPTVDVMLTSAAMEPGGAEAHYTERLVPLPRLGIYYVPNERQDGRRAAFGLPADVPVYLCCQALQKYLPDQDDLFARIAKAVPDARFVFIQHQTALAANESFRARLAAAFAARDLDPERSLVFLPWQPWEDFLRLCGVCDVFLDSIGWSGGNTTLEALAQGIVPVTLPGRFMRGRHTMAMLRMMEMDSLIARDTDDYVTIAARLGRDPHERDHMRALVRERRDRLYKDTEAVRALEAVYVREIAALAASSSTAAV